MDILILSHLDQKPTGANTECALKRSKTGNLIWHVDRTENKNIWHRLWPFYVSNLFYSIQNKKIIKNCTWLTNRAKILVHINSYQFQVEISKWDMIQSVSQSCRQQRLWLQTSPMSGRTQLCCPLWRHHPCTEGAAKAALTGAASQLGIMTHLFILWPQEILTTSPPEEKKKNTVKGT